MAEHTPPPNALALERDEAAARLRIHVRTLDALRHRGEIAFVKIGRRILYRPEDLSEFLARRARKA